MRILCSFPIRSRPHSNCTSAHCTSIVSPHPSVRMPAFPAVNTQTPGANHSNSRYHWHRIKTCKGLRPNITETSQKHPTLYLSSAHDALLPPNAKHSRRLPIRNIVNYQQPLRLHRALTRAQHFYFPAYATIMPSNPDTGNNLPCFSIWNSATSDDSTASLTN